MNPILSSRYYIPDVEARQWEDGRVYLYGSNDKCGHNEYCSKKYHVFSSENMIDWTAHENSFSSACVHDGADKQAALYAPDCVKAGDRYCLFYCQENGGEGIAYSKDPAGPFRDSRPIIPADGQGIDPAALVDDDGSIYYFWGQFSAKGGKLNPKTGEIIPETLKEGILTEKEHGFHEGISVRKRNGIYYLVYADISRGRPTCLGYAVSRSPLGPYEKKGIIIDNTGCDPENWNNHGSIAEINGEWYVFYHRATHKSRFSRQVCVEPIHFNDDGTINEVEMTTQGNEGALNSCTLLEAFRACALTGNCYVDDFHDETGCYEYLSNIHNGDMMIYRYLDFSERPVAVELEVSSNEEGAAVEIYLDEDQEQIAEVKLEETNGRYDFRRSSARIIPPAPEGIHSVKLKAKSSENALICLKSIRFHK